MSAGEGGTASADKTADVAPGATVTLTATPDEGHRFAGWRVNQGGAVIANDNTFAMPAHSVYVDPQFERIDTAPDTPGTGDEGPDSPADPDRNDPAGAQPGSTTTNGTHAGGSRQSVELASTGASTIALMVAAATAIAAGGAMIALKRKCA